MLQRAETGYTIYFSGSGNYTNGKIRIRVNTTKTFPLQRNELFKKIRKKLRTLVFAQIQINLKSHIIFTFPIIKNV